MAEFSVCSDEEVITGRGKKVIVDREEIALFKLDGTIYAISNMCPHQKFQKMHEGMIENGVITCPMHGWAYDVRTGVSTNASGKLKIFTAEVKRGKVIIQIDSPVQ